MFPYYCSHCGATLHDEIPAYNLDNTYGDFYECGIGFEIECRNCQSKYTIVPEDQEYATRIHQELFPYNESPE